MCPTLDADCSLSVKGTYKMLTFYILDIIICILDVLVFYNKNGFILGGFESGRTSLNTPMTVVQKLYCCEEV